MKHCSACKQVKPLDEFGLQASGPMGRTSHCKPCNRARRNLPERRAVQSAKRRDKYRRDDNYRKRIRSQESKQRMTPENRRAACLRQIEFRNTPEGRLTLLVQAAQQRAKKKSVPFELDKFWIADKVDAGLKCELTGLSFTWEYGKPHMPRSMSLDRIIPSKGYTKDNVRLIVWALNAMKGEGSDDEMLEIAEAYLRTRESSRRAGI